MAKKQKAKSKRSISKIKKTNQLQNKYGKKGLLRKARNEKKGKKHFKLTKGKKEKEIVHNQEPQIDDMIDDEDVKFLKNAAKNQSYSLLKGIKVPIESNKKRKQAEDEVAQIEEKYEEDIHSQPVKKTKFLLPYKTKEGLVLRSEEIQEPENEVKEEKDISNVIDVQDPIEGREISTAELLARRENILLKKKIKIGSLCSGILENPENKMNNFKILLDMLKDKDPTACITTKKILLISMYEVFKDVLPSYRINYQEQANVQLKKETIQRRKFEDSVLNVYKLYLQNLEKLSSILKRKKGDTRAYKESELNLAELAVKCYCDLLVSHPNFNYSKNVMHLLVPFLNIPKESVRNLVATAFKSIFKTDKKGEVSLEIVREINKFVKSRHDAVHPEIIKVFLALDLKDVNLDQIKEKEKKEKDLKSKKFNVMQLSKRERKRKKNLQRIENELKETKAEESKMNQLRNVTQITELVFTIYFRILKQNITSKLLNAALQGLAKFAHCINLEFYEDLVNVLNKIIEDQNLKCREKLYCVQTVFALLNYKGIVINIDPIRFYGHFYANIFNIHAGRMHSDLPVLLSTAEMVLVKRGKHASLERLLAFTKRLATLSLQVLPNGILSLLSIIRYVLQVNKGVDLLLDVDSSYGQGIFDPEREDPEYCNASATSLWELTALQRHYHPTVRQYSKFISKMNDPEYLSSNKDYLQQSPEKLFVEYDPSDVKFNPPVPIPQQFRRKKKSVQSIDIKSGEFEHYIKDLLSIKNDDQLNISF